MPSQGAESGEFVGQLLGGPSTIVLNDCGDGLDALGVSGRVVDPQGFIQIGDEVDAVLHHEPANQSAPFLRKLLGLLIGEEELEEIDVFRSSDSGEDLGPPADGRCLAVLGDGEGMTILVAARCAGQERFAGGVSVDVIVQTF